MEHRRSFSVAAGVVHHSIRHADVPQALLRVLFLPMSAVAEQLLPEPAHTARSVPSRLSLPVWLRSSFARRAIAVRTPASVPPCASGPTAYDLRCIADA